MYSANDAKEGRIISGLVERELRRQDAKKGRKDYKWIGRCVAHLNRMASPKVLNFCSKR